ncbi:MAG: hypothetical protein ACON39_04965 [Coraliomargaritaceae bacterium]
MNTSKKMYFESSNVRRRAKHLQKVHRNAHAPVTSDLSVANQNGNLGDEAQKLQFSQRSRPVEPLVLFPFERKVAKSNISEYRAVDVVHGFSLKGLLSPLKVPCPYCSGLIPMRSSECSYCRRGLRNYWLWETAIYKRILLLCALTIGLIGLILLLVYLLVL